MGELHLCELCGRRVQSVTKHHLIPRTRHKNKRNKKNFDREEIHSRVLWLCSPCHKNVHAVLTEKELENQYNTLELLAAHPEIAKFTAWISTKPDGTTVRVHANRSKSEKWK
ncbi:MAG TPA: hypothetical protein VEK08_25120 [Planctomycetota bacterium]|nr:hypothetical protein [Planctomycetota bacterium]